ncbi:glycosyltransferase family 2 protein [Pedobacter xixiisoli]|nr:glycosyltransferase family 2 protein [Pedobacter xixiisoli]
MPCFNNEQHIAEAIGSCLKQTHQNVEIIVVNDGSTDNSKTVIESLSKTDNRIKLFSQNNSGSCAARNTGLNHATGDYIMFLDADDYININTIEAAVKELATCDIVSYNANLVDVNGKILGKKSFKPRYKNLSVSWMEYAPLNGCVIFNRNLASHQWNQQFDAIDEFDYYVRLALSAPKHSYLNKTYFSYRQHESVYRKSNKILPYGEQLSKAFENYLSSNEYKKSAVEDIRLRAYNNFIIDEFNLPLNKMKISKSCYIFFLLQMKKKTTLKKILFDLFR